MSDVLVSLLLAAFVVVAGWALVHPDTPDGYNLAHDWREHAHQ
jgi:hypothetical protein